MSPFGWETNLKDGEMPHNDGYALKIYSFI